VSCSSGVDQRIFLGHCCSSWHRARTNLCTVIRFKPVGWTDKSTKVDPIKSQRHVLWIFQLKSSMSARAATLLVRDLSPDFRWRCARPANFADLATLCPAQTAAVRFFFFQTSDDCLFDEGRRADWTIREWSDGIDGSAMADTTTQGRVGGRMMLNRRIECEILRAATSRFRVPFSAEPLGCGQLMMVTMMTSGPFASDPQVLSARG
jgi:hypothetical protein